MRKMIHKLRSNKGESIVETLVAVLIVTMAMTILAGGITMAAKINHKVDKADTSFSFVSAGSGTASKGGVSTQKDASGGYRFALSGGTSAGGATIDLYQSEEGYYYYDYTVSK